MVNFGGKSAEFVNLREEVSAYIEREMINSKPPTSDSEEWEQRVSVCIKNNQHYRMSVEKKDQIRDQVVKFFGSMV